MMSRMVKKGSGSGERPKMEVIFVAGAVFHQRHLHAFLSQSWVGVKHRAAAGDPNPSRQASAGEPKFKRSNQKRLAPAGLSW